MRAEAVPSESASRAGSLQLIGGNLALDFVNTATGRDTPDFIEHLREPGHVLAWGAHVGLVDPAEDRRAAALLRDPAAAAHALDRALDLRELLYRLFVAVTRSEAATREVAELNDWVAGSLGDLRLFAGVDGYGWEWAPPRAPFDGVLRPVIRAAAELLAGGPLDRMKQCCGPDCRWLFLDQTKNRSRVWCEMGVCGNRAKSRRRYARQKSLPK